MRGEDAVDGLGEGREHGGVEPLGESGKGCGFNANEACGGGGIGWFVRHGFVHSYES